MFVAFSCSAFQAWNRVDEESDTDISSISSDSESGKSFATRQRMIIATRNRSNMKVQSVFTGHTLEASETKIEELSCSVATVKKELKPSTEIQENEAVASESDCAHQQFRSDVKAYLNKLSRMKRARRRKQNNIIAAQKRQVVSWPHKPVHEMIARKRYQLQKLKPRLSLLRSSNLKLRANQCLLLSSMLRLRPSQLLLCRLLKLTRQR